MTLKAAKRVVATENFVLGSLYFCLRSRVGKQVNIIMDKFKLTCLKYLNRENAKYNSVYLFVLIQIINYVLSYNLN